MKTLTLTSLAAASLIGLTVAASAQPIPPAAGPCGGPQMGFGRMGAGPMMGFGPAGREEAFKKFDANGDGKITRDEVEAYREKSLAAANPNGDGVTIQQFEPWFWQQHREMMVRAFQRLDRDGDGKISQDEVKQATDAMFDRFDRNGDGVLSADDCPAPREGMGPGMGRGRGMGMGPGMGQGMGRGHGMGGWWNWGGNDGDDAPAPKQP